MVHLDKVFHQSIPSSAFVEYLFPMLMITLMYLSSCNARIISFSENEMFKLLIKLIYGGLG